MVPKLEDKYDMLRTLSDAIKAVYASVFYRDSKAYMTATSNLIDQEKMAIVLQEVVGNRYNDRFYPTISGVARSLNFYPIGNEKAEERDCQYCFGAWKIYRRRRTDFTFLSSSSAQYFADEYDGLCAP